MSLKDERKKKKLSQIELAHAVGLSQSMIQQMESGEKHGSVSTNIKIANYLGVSMEAILSGFENTESNKRIPAKREEAVK